MQIYHGDRITFEEFDKFDDMIFDIALAHYRESPESRVPKGTIIENRKVTNCDIKKTMGTHLKRGGLKALVFWDAQKSSYKRRPILNEGVNFSDILKLIYDVEKKGDIDGIRLEVNGDFPGGLFLSFFVYLNKESERECVYHRRKIEMDKCSERNVFVYTPGNWEEIVKSEFDRLHSR